MKNADLKKRIIEISFKHKLSHLGSCLFAVDIIDLIYATKKTDEKFVLSCGHAGLALYAVIEKYEKIDAEQIFLHHGIHPDRCDQCHLYCSSGSLGHGLPIALGMALADRTKNVYCLISDGECAEGSIWESLNIMEENEIKNIKIFVNLNGFGAYRKINTDNLVQMMLAHCQKTKDNFYFADKYFCTSPFGFLKNDLSDHYHVLTEKEYEDACNLCLS